jgi:hypothetical protein
MEVDCLMVKIFPNFLSTVLINYFVLEISTPKIGVEGCEMFVV